MHQRQAGLREQYSTKIVHGVEFGARVASAKILAETAIPIGQTKKPWFLRDLPRKTRVWGQ